MTNRVLTKEQLAVYNIPLSHLRTTPDLEKVDPKYRQSLQKLLDEEKKGVFLAGPNGCGKTYIGCALMIRFMQHNYMAYRMSFHDLLKTYTETGWDVPVQAMQPLLLFIDEVGKEDQKESAHKVLERVIRTRLERNKYTVIATNLTPDTFFKKYGGTVKSDLKGFFIGLNMPERDRRI